MLFAVSVSIQAVNLGIRSQNEAGGLFFKRGGNKNQRSRGTGPAMSGRGPVLTRSELHARPVTCGMPRGIGGLQVKGDG